MNRCIGRLKPQGPEHFEVVAGLVNLADGAGTLDRVGEKATPGIGVVSGANRDTCKLRDNGGLDGVLEKDGAVETARPEFPRQLPDTTDSRMPPRLFIHNDFIDIGAGLAEIRHPGLDQDGNMRLGKCEANGPQGRKVHDDIADPVGAADEDMPDLIRTDRGFAMHLQFATRYVIHRACFRLTVSG